MAKVKDIDHLQRRPSALKVSEAVVSYIVDRREGDATTTISSKNQITLPAHMLRELGLTPGDRLTVAREGDRLVLRPRPKDWVQYYAGSLRGVYGRTTAELDEYVSGLRAEGAREEELERAWTEGTRSPQE